MKPCVNVEIALVFKSVAEVTASSLCSLALRFSFLKAAVWTRACLSWSIISRARFYLSCSFLTLTMLRLGMFFCTWFSAYFLSEGDVTMFLAKDCMVAVETFMFYL